MRELHNDPAVSRPNPLVWLAFAAAATSRIRLGIARTEAERSGRSPDRIEVTYLGAPNSAEIEAADRAGVDRYIVMDRTADFTREPERLIALAETLRIAPARSAAIASAESPG